MRKKISLFVLGLILAIPAIGVLHADQEFNGPGTWSGPAITGNCGTGTTNPNGTVTVHCSGTGNCWYTTNGGHTLVVKGVINQPDNGYDPNDASQDSGTLINN